MKRCSAALQTIVAKARPVRSNEPLCACSAESKVALNGLLAFTKFVVFVVLLANKYIL